MQILHRHGGVIEAVHAIEHSTYKRVADWEFRGRVRWQDGSVSEDAHIAPHCVCHDDSQASQERVRELMAQLSAYLERHGDWHEPKYMRDGRVVNWTPHKPEGREALAP